MAAGGQATLSARTATAITAVAADSTATTLSDPRRRATGCHLFRAVDAQEVGDAPGVDMAAAGTAGVGEGIRPRRNSSESPRPGAVFQRLTTYRLSLMGVLGLKLIAGLGALQRRTGTGLIDGHEQATIKAWSDSSEAFRHRNCVVVRRQ
jgi:hypothetical protein